MNISSIWPVIVVIMVIAPATLFIQQVVQEASDRQIIALAKLQAEVGSTANQDHLITEVIRAINKNSPHSHQDPISLINEEEVVDLAKCVVKEGEKQCWREAKRRVWLKGLNEIEKLPESELKKFRHPIKNWEPFDLITPTHECDLNEFSRLGDTKDGGKWICGPLTFGDDCVLFSLGSNNHFIFEESMQIFTQGKCRVFTFDCTGNWSDPSTNFYPWCIAGKDYTDANGRIYKRISTIFNDLKLTQINHLKMDIEGYEWLVFRDILQSENKLALPKQISFELHVDMVDAPWSPKEELGKNNNWAYPMINLLKVIDNAGYRFAASELNIYCKHCSEYVIVREEIKVFPFSLMFLLCWRDTRR